MVMKNDSKEGYKTCVYSVHVCIFRLNRYYGIIVGLGLLKEIE